MEEYKPDPVAIARGVLEVMTIAFEALVAKDLIAAPMLEKMLLAFAADAQEKGEGERAAVYGWLLMYLSNPQRKQMIDLLMAPGEGQG